MVAVFTYAYNAERTLRRTVESVLNQTYTDWVYYLCDNGSTEDNTRKIIEEYASKDSRIIPIYIDKNDPYEASRIGFTKIFTSDAEFFCMVDADDEYYPEFLEKTLAFMNTHDLDIAACGSDFIDVETMRLCNKRLSNGIIILEDRLSYNNNFARSHQFMRTIWGKLYRVSLFQNFDYISDEWEYYQVAYGGDTIFFMKAALYAQKVGVLNEILHKYYVSSKSVSYKWKPLRPQADMTLYDYALEFLLQKAGFVSEYNKWFLDRVYLSAIDDTLNVLFLSDLNHEQRFSVLRDIFSCKHTISAFTNERVETELKKNMLDKIWHTIIKHTEMQQLEDGIWVGLNLAALRGDEDAYVQFSLLNIESLIKRGLISEAESELTEWGQMLQDCQELERLTYLLQKKKSKMN